MISLSKTLWRLRVISRKLWVRTTLIAMLSLASAALATALGPLIPKGLSDRFGADSTLPLLNILSSSMLAVTTFSLSVMVSTNQAAQSNATPRAHRVLSEDTTTQTVLATFIGAFIFSLAAIVLYRAGFYHPSAMVVVFAATVLVIALVIVAILRWINHLSALGSVDHVIRVIEDRARNALEARSEAPTLFAMPLAAPIASGAIVRASESGYVQFIDIAALNKRAEDAEAQVQILIQPGDYVLSAAPLAVIAGGEAEAAESAQACFTIGDMRTFDQDARFGVVVLSEIATRALSPGVNDPGTAIDVIARLEGMLWTLGAAPDGAPIHYARVSIAPVSPGDLIEDAFAPIARYGADSIEVARRLRRALARLQDSPDPEMKTAAREMAALALSYAETALPIPQDVDRLKEISA